MTPADEIRKLFELFEAEVGDIDETLSPTDTMWEGDEPHYRKVGESAIRAVRLALLAANKPPASVNNILDFGSGHGRVMRYLQRIFPDAAFTACDVDREGVDFCAKTFGATPVYSSPDLRQVTLPTRYDLIWCGSLFTHVDKDHWTELLRLFESVLTDRGVLIFTVGGSTVPKLVKKGWDYFLSVEQLGQVIADYRRDGFGFVEYDGHEGYGITIASPTWATETIASSTDLSLLLYLERGWDDHQDVVACVNGMTELAPGPFLDKTADVDL